MTDLEAAMQPVLALEETVDNFAATANRIADQLIEARARNLVLGIALKRHGVHSPGCRHYKCLPCSCGLGAALNLVAP
jgi:hypothetical protein